jgi:putative hemolysin
MSPGTVAVNSALSCLHRAGALEVRLAASETELRAAQEHLYRVFYEEQQAVSAAPAARLNADPDDPVCDHLLVIDHAARRVVGAYP